MSRSTATSLCPAAAAATAAAVPAAPVAMAQQQDHAQLGTVIAAGGVGAASALALLAAGALFVRGRRKLGRPTVQRRA